MRDAAAKQIVDSEDLVGLTIEKVNVDFGEARIKFTDGRFAILAVDRDEIDPEIEMSRQADIYAMIELGLVTYTDHVEENKAQIEVHEQSKRDQERNDYERLKKKFESGL